jgi:parvulin-like peptidyl-prolyl isomerase
VSDVVASSFGYHLIKVTAIEKGETADQDQVKASHILQLYTPNQALVRQVTQRVHAGKADVAFVNDEYLQYAPDMYR